MVLEFLLVPLRALAGTILPQYGGVSRVVLANLLVPLRTLAGTILPQYGNVS